MKYYVTSHISDNIHETPEGYLVCIGVSIARTGEMTYGEGETPIEADSKGIVKITRDEADVFRPETIASFEGKAVTITHPKEFVGPNNWSTLAKGILQNVRRGKGDQKDDLIADLLITDSMAIGLVKRGLRQVSCGYEADYEETGDARGKQYNIIGNHLALVDQGRAGPEYAINDHKGEIKMDFKKKISALFAKAQDEAIKVIDEEAKKDDAKDEDPKKDDKAKDEDPKKDDKAKDANMYDELVKMVADLGDKLEAMKGKDQAEGETDNPEDDNEEKKDDEDKPKDAEGSSVEERLATLEACIKKLMGADDEKSDEDKTDDDKEEDDDFDESTMVGDTLSRAEILAPGIKKSKDIKAQALKTAYGTKEGKQVIDSLTGGKSPVYDSKEKVDTLFIAASEVLKATRTKDLSKTKTSDFVSDYSSDSGSGPMTPEKMNEINAKYYKTV